jgi:antitoxin (DNA-binding transcriptional repressor) of toxin-antitoxin stability system
MRYEHSQTTGAEMTVRVTVDELQEQLPELLDRTVERGEECIVQREGEDYAIIIGVREWRRRTAQEPRAFPSVSADEEETRSQEIGRRLDALGPAYRVSSEKQARLEELLARREMGSLTAAEQRELDALRRIG